MRILVDILHPAHVHFFKNAIALWKQEHEVVVTSRRKDVTQSLLSAFGIDSLCLSEMKPGIAALFCELVVRDLRLLSVCLEFKPDVLTGIAGVSIAHVGALLGIPSIVFYDTEFARLSNAITYPLASVVCTPSCYQGDIGKKHVRYPGYHELAYLHPKRFQPSLDILARHGLSNRKFFLLRFVSWQASHDFRETGFSTQQRHDLIRLLEQYGQVVISSEAELPAEFAKYKLVAAVSEVHHVMAFAAMVIGESATMCSEAAMLGVPSVYVAKSGRGYTDELEQRYGLVVNLIEGAKEGAISIIKQLVEQPNLKEECQEKRCRMLSERIDVSDFVRRFVIAYPTATGNPQTLAQSIMS